MYIKKKRENRFKISGPWPICPCAVCLCLGSGGRGRWGGAAEGNVSRRKPFYTCEDGQPTLQPCLPQLPGGPVKEDRGGVPWPPVLPGPSKVEATLGGQRLWPPCRNLVPLAAPSPGPPTPGHSGQHGGVGGKPGHLCSSRCVVPEAPGRWTKRTGESPVPKALCPNCPVDGPLAWPILAVVAKAGGAPVAVPGPSSRVGVGEGDEAEAAEMKGTFRVCITGPSSGRVCPPLTTTPAQVPTEITATPLTSSSPPRLSSSPSKFGSLRTNSVVLGPLARAPSHAWTRCTGDGGVCDGDLAHP